MNILFVMDLTNLESLENILILKKQKLSFTMRCLEKDLIEIGPAIHSVIHLPTPFGHIDFNPNQGISFGRWRRGIKKLIKAFEAQE